MEFKLDAPGIRSAIIGTFMVVNGWRTYLMYRNIRRIVSTTKPPLGVLMTKEVFEETRSSLISEHSLLAINIVFEFGVNVAKVLSKYFPYIWRLTGDYVNTPVRHVMCFAALDVSVTTAVIHVPLACIGAIINKSQRPWVDAFVAITASVAYAVVRGVLNAIAAWLFMFTFDYLGINTHRQVVTGLLVVNALGHLVLSISLLFPMHRSDLPDSDMGTNVEGLSLAVGYPSSTIYIDETYMPEGVQYRCALFSRSLVISGRLLSWDAAEVTALVAHEMGHWRYWHKAFTHASFTAEIIAAGYLCTLTYGNKSILQAFHMDPEAHRFIPTYLIYFFAWPVFRDFYKGTINVIKSSFEYSADNYACRNWPANFLRLALTRQAPSQSKNMMMDSWYTSWVDGEPSLVKRIRAIQEKEDK